MIVEQVLGDAKMIMRNEQKIKNIHAKRIFTMILQAAKPYFTPFDADYKHCTVRGVLNTNDLGLRAAISYDERGS